MVSFAFYDRSGNLQVSYDLFKSIMNVISSLMGRYVIYLYLKKTEDEFIKEGRLIGITWLVLLCQFYQIIGLKPRPINSNEQ